MFYWFIKGLAWPIVTLYLRFRRYGKGRVPADGSVIVVANHTSYLDAICLGSACPRKLNFLIAWEIYRMRRLRWFYFMMDAIPLRTEGADTAALRRALEVLRAGGAVGIFPEGQRMKDGATGEGKIGVAFLASRTGARVVPAAIVGAHRAMPVGALFPRPYQVKVVFGEAMTFPRSEGKSRKATLEAFADEVMDRIVALGAPASVAEKSEGMRRTLGEEGR